MRLLMALSCLALTASVQADIIKLPSAPVVIDGEGIDFKRVCYYEGKSYSSGAILQVGRYYLRCQPTNKQELNGPLKWEPVDAIRQNPTAEDSVTDK